MTPIYNISTGKPLTDYTEQQLLDALDFVRLKSNASIEISTDITMTYNDNTKEIVVAWCGDDDDDDDIYGYRSITIPVSAITKIKMFCSCFVADENGAYKFNP